MNSTESGSSTEKYLCLTCREDFLQENLIEVFGNSGIEWEISTIVSKHLGFIQFHDLESLFICKDCWKNLNGFHRYYTKIVNAYNLYFKTIEAQFNEESEPNIESIIKQQHSSLPTSGLLSIKDTHINSNSSLIYECKLQNGDDMDEISDNSNHKYNSELKCDNVLKYDNELKNDNNFKYENDLNNVWINAPSTSRKPQYASQNMKPELRAKIDAKYDQYLKTENLCHQYPSRRGKPKLFRDEFSYVQHTCRKRDDRYLWRCDKARNYDCPAKMYTVLRGKDHYFMHYINDHNCTDLPFSNKSLSNSIPNENSTTTQKIMNDPFYEKNYSEKVENLILEDVGEYFDPMGDIIEIDD